MASEVERAAWSYPNSAFERMGLISIVATVRASA